MNITRLQRLCNCLVMSASKRLRSDGAMCDQAKVFTQTRNPITGSTEWDIQHEDYDYHQEIARSAFADMLHDSERNQKYYAALKLAIEKMHAAGKEANVLDIGTGTGLLSIMAARCGADSIVACEAFKPMAECCLKILEQNGVAEKITLIPKRSTELTVGKNGDMKFRANILVTEVFDTELIGEGALPTFSHAHEHLMEKDSIVVPDSAVVYGQVTSSFILQDFNKLNDITDDDAETVLKVPQKIANCPGSAAVHDLQLSQLAIHQFVDISNPLPMFYFDWSGRSPIHKRRTVKQSFTPRHPTNSEMVLVWWELNMDTEGRIRLSCAPWWAHPDGDITKASSRYTIPWRDHWMQAVYYLPKPIPCVRDSELDLVACHDEYSLWFYMEDSTTKYKSYPRPVCECGVHMAFSRTHISYLNDSPRWTKMLKHLEEQLKELEDPIVLDLNGSSLLGLAAAKIGASKVYILETMNLNIGFMRDYIEANMLANVEIISELSDEILGKVSMVTCDPNFSSSILPWENLKMAHILLECRDKLKKGVKVIPESCEFWAMPVRFKNLDKIRTPLGVCEGVNMSIFDELVEKSRKISDANIESHPLWEYPTASSGEPRKLFEIDMRQLNTTYSSDESYQIADDLNLKELEINGFTIWPVWNYGLKGLSTGPNDWPLVGEWVFWYPFARQAVKILKKKYKKSVTDKWSCQVSCNLSNGQFEVDMDFEPKETEVPAEMRLEI